MAVEVRVEGLLVVQAEAATEPEVVQVAAELVVERRAGEGLVGVDWAAVGSALAAGAAEGLVVAAMEAVRWGAVDWVVSQVVRVI